MPGDSRWAPFGVPVVPDVRITKRLRLLGRVERRRGGARDRLLGDGSAVSSPSSTQETKRDSFGASPSAPVEQLLELGVVDQRLRLLALDHAEELRAGEVRVQQSTDAPSLAQARIASTKPRWLRHMTATASPGSTPLLAAARGRASSSAVELAERELAELVDQSAIVGSVDRGGRRSIPAAGEAPQRRSARDPRPAGPGRHRPDDSRLGQRLDVEREVGEMPSPRR